MPRSEEFEVTAPARLEVQIPAGEVVVRSGRAGAISITVDSSGDDVEIARFGSTVTVEYRRPSRFRGRAVRLVAEVPDGTDVEAGTASARIRLHGSLGAVRLKTASGDVEVASADRIDVSTVSGSLRVDSVGADAACRSVSGSCRVARVGGRWSASSTSGNLRSDRVGGDVDVVTTSGDVRIDRCEGDDVNIRSVSGNIRVGLPTGIKVDADISTYTGRTVLPDPVPAPSDAPRRQVRLRLQSVSGDLLVERAP